jgi:hypothetical protein
VGQWVTFSEIQPEGATLLIFSKKIFFPHVPFLDYFWAIGQYKWILRLHIPCKYHKTTIKWAKMTKNWIYRKK